jgi:hypothetical protein
MFKFIKRIVTNKLLYKTVLLFLSACFVGAMLSLSVYAQTSKTSIEDTKQLNKASYDIVFLQDYVKEQKERDKMVLEKMEKLQNDLSTIRGIGMGLGVLMGLVQIVQILASTNVIIKKSRSG